jgi:hypothetical protein
MTALPLSILAHNGCWRAPEDKNSISACRLALTSGFGLQVDIRDHVGELVVAYEPDEAGHYPFRKICTLMQQHPGNTLALNIRSTGLQHLLCEALAHYTLTDYFLYDMSVPDLLAALQSGLRCFTRQSELETTPVLYPQSHGVWVDMYEQDWLTSNDIRMHLKHAKDVAMASPELHGRDHLPFWHYLKDHWASLGGATSKCYLSTAYPEQAAAFFYPEP